MRTVKRVNAEVDVSQKFHGALAAGILAESRLEFAVVLGRVSGIL